MDQWMSRESGESGLMAGLSAAVGGPAGGAPVEPERVRVPIEDPDARARLQAFVSGAFCG
jgi:hypothetical protein